MTYHCIHHFLYRGYALHVGWVVLLPPWLCRGKSAGIDLQSAVNTTDFDKLSTSTHHTIGKYSDARQQGEF